jgi:hypothetical protein
MSKRTLEQPLAEDALEGLAAQGIAAMQRYFAQVERTDKDIREARVAATILSTWSRLRQTQGARDTLHFAMARELAADKTQLEAYIRAAFPKSPMGQLSANGGGAMSSDADASAQH